MVKPSSSSRRTPTPSESDDDEEKKPNHEYQRGKWNDLERNINILVGEVNQSNICSPMSNITATGSHRILQERSGKVTGSYRKAPKIAGSGSGIPTGNLLDFFR
jgi:hypothetical protein